MCAPNTLSNHPLCQTGFAFDGAFDRANVSEHFNCARLQAVCATCGRWSWTVVNVEDREAISGAAE